MARNVYYVAASLDGFIADAEGGVGWLEPWGAEELGYEAFLAGVGAVVIGRTTYEQLPSLGPWPCGEREVLVVTTRPLAGARPRVSATTVAELGPRLAALRERARGDVWIVGGGQTARACVAAELLDELELYLVPATLGRGIPLLGEGPPIALRLLESHPFANGVVKLRYAIERRR
jgi:dihydrofolate reductase